MKKVIIYTDGACRGNPGKGGYGAVLCYIDPAGEEHFRKISQGYQKTTNNRMELLAVIEGLKMLKTACQVELHSDSKYIVDAINKSWIQGWQQKGWTRGKGKPLLNPDLWKQIWQLIHYHQVTFHWVKGHAGHRYNEMCDQLATAAADGQELQIDEGYQED